MKDFWIESLNKIGDIFQEADLIDLIAEGAPKDEYDLLALEVFTRMMVVPVNKKVLRDFIHEAIERGFSDQVPVDGKKLDALVDVIASESLLGTRA